MFGMVSMDSELRVIFKCQHQAVVVIIISYRVAAPSLLSKYNIKKTDGAQGTAEQIEHLRQFRSFASSRPPFYYGLKRLLSAVIPAGLCCGLNSLWMLAPFHYEEKIEATLRVATFGFDGCEERQHLLHKWFQTSIRGQSSCILICTK